MSQLERCYCLELSQNLELINPSHIITRPLMVRILPPPAWKLSYQIILTDDYQPRLTCVVGGQRCTKPMSPLKVLNSAANR